MFETIFRSAKNVIVRIPHNLLTICGISVGIAAVMLTLGIGNYGSSILMREIDELGVGGLSISASRDSVPLTKNELGEIRRINYVSQAMPVVFETASVSIKGKQKKICLWGIDHNADKTISLDLICGRFFDPVDISDASRVCMIDESFALSNYGTDNVTGKYLTISSGDTTSDYKITGVLKTGSGLLESFMGNVIPDFIYIPYSTLQNNLAYRNYSQVVLKLDDSVDPEAAEADIKKTIERKTGVKDGYTINNLAKQKDSIDNIIRIFTLVITSLGAVSLFVAGLNIMNVMLASVSERTGEIGIKKAIGASNCQILTEFICESIVISFLGCFLGLSGSSIVLLSISVFFGLTIIPDIVIMFILMFFAMLTGAAFGSYPAIKAASLKPVEALRKN